MILLTFLFDLIKYISVIDLWSGVSFSSSCLCKICWLRTARLTAHASAILLRARGVAALAMPLQQTSPRKNCLCPRCLSKASSHGNHTSSTQMSIVFRHFPLLGKNDVKSEGAEEQERNLTDMQAANAITLPYLSRCFAIVSQIIRPEFYSMRYTLRALH